MAAVTTIILAALLYTVVQSEPDPCENHSTFPISLLGSRNEQCAPSPGPMCDYYLQDDWYLVENATILSQCPTGGCGFAYPAWMNGTLPTVADGIVERQICIKHYSDCCKETMTIRMKNCQGFHVYYLKHFEGCPSGYCFESTFPCGQPIPATTKPTVDPCENPSPFPSNNFGSRNEQCEPQFTPACDYYLPQDWYTVDEGALLTHCPFSGNCGVGYPVWLNGSFPEASDGIVERVVCKKDYADCCKSTFSIHMKKCSHGFVYNLPPLDACPSAYCFESNLPCIAPRRAAGANGQRPKDDPKNNPDSLLIAITVLSSLVLIIMVTGLIIVIYKRCNKTPPCSVARLYQVPRKCSTVTSDKIKTMHVASLHVRPPSPPPAYEKQPPVYDDVKCYYP